MNQPERQPISYCSLLDIRICATYDYTWFRTADPVLVEADRGMIVPNASAACSSYQYSASIDLLCATTHTCMVIRAKNAFFSTTGV